MVISFRFDDLTIHKLSNTEIFPKSYNQTKIRLRLRLKDKKQTPKKYVYKPMQIEISDTKLK